VVDPTKSGLDVPPAQGGIITPYPCFGADDSWGQLRRDLSKLSPAKMSFAPFPSQLHDLLRAHASQVPTGNIDSDAATDSLLDAAERDSHLWLAVSDDSVLIPRM
jgi:hypothetical protein